MVLCGMDPLTYAHSPGTLRVINDTTFQKAFLGQTNSEEGDMKATEKWNITKKTIVHYRGLQG